MQEGVVLLHGIFRTSRSMASLSRTLRKHGYWTLNMDYDSRHYRIEDLAEQIHERIEEFCHHVNGPIHFVGHSMGGLLIRRYVHVYRPKRMGRVVMIGTPNKGSEVADTLHRYWLFRKIYGPAGQQLITDQSRFIGLLGKVDYDLGIIAGNGSIDPIGSLIIGTDNDGKVSVESTKLEGMKAHKVVPVSHTFLPESRQVKEFTLQFLQYGRADC